MDRRALPGIPGVGINAGDHLCALYTNRDERDDVVTPFLREGLSRGDKCLVGLGNQDTGAVSCAIGPQVNVTGCVRSRQLEMLDSADTILSPEEFATDDVIAFWEGMVCTAVTTDGYGFARLIVEFSMWEPALRCREALAGYESALTALAARQPLAVLCLHHTRTFDGGVIINLVKTHPRILLSGTVFDNPYHAPAHSAP